MTRPPENESEPLLIGGIPIRTGDRIGSYVFVREVGSGGMARVLLARDPTGVLVALKVLRKSRFKTGLFRFRREFRALSRINHPNVIRVDAYGDLHGHPFIAMEYVEGPDLHTTIRAFRTWEPEKRWARVEAILIDLCRALAAIHRHGLVHRDLKPSNVLIDAAGTCKLTDFGIVKDLDPAQDPHLSTTLVGTWAYSSPEQITGNPIDHRSDLYSLGVILFAMLTGKRPFVANDMAGYLTLHRDRQPPAPRDVISTIPAHLDEICRRLLQKAPRDRYQSAQEILYRLEVEERDTGTPDGESWEPRLAGRSLELEAIDEALAGLIAGRGGLVVLEGEDGSGKSRLLAEVVDRARTLGLPARLLEVRRDDPVFTTTLTLAEALQRDLGDRTPPSLRTSVETYTQQSRLQGDARYALYDGVREALILALEQGPRVLALDDLHEAHAPEIELVTYLLRNLPNDVEHPWLVVTTLRAKANPATDALANGEGLPVEPREISVGPLSEDDVEAIVASLVGSSEASAALALRLHAETEGNAFFVTEFLRNLMTRQVIRSNGKTWTLVLPASAITRDHLEIPPGIRQVLRARLAGLAADEQRILEVLAVGAPEVDLDVLLDVLDEDEDAVMDRVDRLIQAGIVRERRSADTVTHGMVHRKFADVVYRDLHTDRRARLHRKVAAALELHYAHDPAVLEVIGEHYRKAGEAGRAYRYLVAAARRLADRSLSQEAWELSERAASLEESARLDLSEEEFRRFRRDDLDVRASVRYNRAEWVEAERTYRLVLDLAETDRDDRGACKVRIQLATVLRRRGVVSESRRLALEGLEMSRRLHYREGVAEALHCLAAIAWTGGDLAECERLANEGLLVAQGGALADQRAELLLALTTAQATRGHLASATSGLMEAEGIFRELRMKRPRCLALANIAELLTWQGAPLEARQRAHAAVLLAEELDYHLGRVAALRAMSVAALDLGMMEDGCAGLTEALAGARRIQVHEESLACLVALAQAALERGDLSEARRCAGDGLQLAVHRDPEATLPLLRVLLARALAPKSALEARTLLEGVETGLEELQLPRRTQVQLAMAWAWLQLGEPARASGLARAVLQTAGSRGFRLRALEARALLCSLTLGEEQDHHRQAGQDAAREFAATLPSELRPSFAARPFFKLLRG